MIDRQGRQRLISFICDGDRCYESVDTATDDWNEALSRMKAEDWTIIRSDGSFLHLCPECSDG